MIKIETALWLFFTIILIIALIFLSIVLNSVLDSIKNREYISINGVIYKCEKVQELNKK